MKVNVFLKSMLLYASNEILLSYKKGYLLVSRTKLPKKVIQKHKISHFPFRSKFFDRLMRNEPRCVAPLNNNQFLISYNGRIINYCVKKNTSTVEHLFRQGMKNPLGFCVIQKTGGDNVILYGEYTQNIDLGPVAIFKRDEGKWSKVYEFPHKTIKHIHNIVFDQKRKQFIILTGDSDAESGIWLADEDFKKVIPAFIGKQHYRTCMLFPHDFFYLYATDTPLGENRLLKLFTSEDHYGLIETLLDLAGTCIFATKYKENYYFSTAVEPDPMLQPWRYLLTRSPSKSNIDRCARVYKLSPDNCVSELIRLEKDWLPMGLFQFGNVLFPYNESEELYITTRAVAPGHGFTLRLDMT